MTERSQLSLAYSLACNTLFTFKPDVGPCQSVFVEQLGPETAALLGDKLQLYATDCIYHVNWVELEHYRFKPKSIVVIDIADKRPTFGSIQAIFAVSGDIILLLKKLEMLHFDEHFAAYEVKDTDDMSGSLEVLMPLKDVKDHHPLQLQTVQYTGRNRQLISVRYTLIS